MPNDHGGLWRLPVSPLNFSRGGQLASKFGLTDRAVVRYFQECNSISRCWKLDDPKEWISGILRKDTVYTLSLLDHLTLLARFTAGRLIRAQELLNKAWTDRQSSMTAAERAFIESKKLCQAPVKRQVQKRKPRSKENRAGLCVCDVLKATQLARTEKEIVKGRILANLTGETDDGAFGEEFTGLEAEVF